LQGERNTARAEKEKEHAELEELRELHSEVNKDVLVSKKVEKIQVRLDEMEEERDKAFDEVMELKSKNEELQEKYEEVMRVN